MSDERKPLSVATDKRVRAIRDRMNAAKLRIQIAMQFTMHKEVREQLRSVQSDLAVALAHIGE